MLDSIGVRPWIIYGDIRCVFSECVVYVHNLCVSNVGTVFLKCNAKDEDLGILNLNTLKVHSLNGLVCYVRTHAIIKTTSREHDARKNAIYLSFLNKVIGINRDTVTTDKTRGELDEVPLR